MRQVSMRQHPVSCSVTTIAKKSNLKQCTEILWVMSQSEQDPVLSLWKWECSMCLCSSAYPLLVDSEWSMNGSGYAAPSFGHRNPCSLQAAHPVYPAPSPGTGGLLQLLLGLCSHRDPSCHRSFLEDAARTHWHLYQIEEPVYCGTTELWIKC